jgi:hypothetical protein
MVSRRSFLIGLGGILTSGFVTRVCSHVRATSSPLLLDPGRIEETLFVNPTYSDGPNFWSLSLGPEEMMAPPPPTWREHLGLLDRAPEDIQRVLDDRSMTVEALDQPLDEFGWEDLWEYRNSPTAKAYWLLKELGVGHALGGSGRSVGRLEYHRQPNPMSSWHWVELRDSLSISLLQAHLVDAGHPIRVAMAEV